MANACVLMADITGSTPLYERMSQQDALQQISLMLTRMRTIIEEVGGHCIKSQGDDTLSVFRHAHEGFRAARHMIEDDWDHDLSVHAGLFFGEVLRHDNDIYGNAVNTAARLASLAKPGEVLVGDESFDRLDTDTQVTCVPLGGIKLKGKKQPTRVFSFTANQLASQTVIFGANGPKLGRRTDSAVIELAGKSWTIANGETLTIGRSDDCDIVLPHAWISRQHGKLDLHDLQLEYSDHSSTGSSVITSDGQAFEVHRRTTLLSGDGTVLLGTSDRSITSSALLYATNDLIPD